MVMVMVMMMVMMMMMMKVTLNVGEVMVIVMVLKCWPVINKNLEINSATNYNPIENDPTHSKMGS